MLIGSPPKMSLRVFAIEHTREGPACTLVLSEMIRAATGRAGGRVHAISPG
jgi:hypothetical protein